MIDRELLKKQLDVLPDFSIEKIIEFVNYQKFLIGYYDNDSEYLASIPGMEKSIVDGLNTPLSECSRSIE